MKYLLVFTTIALFFVSCAKKRAEEQAIEDENIIKNYISSEGITETASGTGLYYVIDELGAGASCDQSSTVRVAYEGYLTNGSTFDVSTDEGITFGLQSVIQGWTEGIPYFKVGGSGILLIPSALGYGENAVGSIPANSVLIFDVELLEVL